MEIEELGFSQSSRNYYLRLTQRNLCLWELIFFIYKNEKWKKKEENQFLFLQNYFISSK